VSDATRTQPLLNARGVTKRFAGITALVNVSLAIGPSETVGLIGPNGAGKTTFFDCLNGTLRPDNGDIEFANRTITHMPRYRRARVGIGRTFQRVELFPGMTVRGHLLVAEQSRLGSGGLWRDVTFRGRPTADELQRTDRTLELLGLDGSADRPIEALTLGHTRLVELGRALMTEPKLLLLDEPSSGLDRAEARAMAKVLADVQRERGTAVLLVEHDVELVAEVTTRLYVLDLGNLIAEGPTTEVLDDPAVRHAYLGMAEEL
jgi:branched-chain amino acid transport system ATP-binding protein